MVARAWLGYSCPVARLLVRAAEDHQSHHLNIQRVKALVGDAGVTPKRLNVCTSCLKAGKVKR